eukprot:Rhum_TRINITY_DN8184_c0_g1::Rhum_TRINITY_DN8184_c0_g1_i1::g.26600::m.26600
MGCEGAPLWQAAAEGDVARARELLCCGEDPETRHEGQTPLMFAAANGCAEVVRLLIANGVDVMRTDSFEMTALHWAVRNTHLEVASVLMQHGALTDCPSRLFGETPCDIAKVRGDHAMCRLVIWNNRSGANIPATSSASEQPESEQPAATASVAHDASCAAPVEASPLQQEQAVSPTEQEVDTTTPVQRPHDVVAPVPPPIPERKRVPPPPQRPAPRPIQRPLAV